MKSPITAIIFDLDEVLVDNYANHITATDAIMAPFQIVGKENVGESEEYTGMRCSDIIWDIMQKLHIPMDRFGDIFQKRQALFVSLVEKNCPAMPGVEHITKLAKDMGMKTALASSGSPEYIAVCLKKLGLEQYFDAIVSGEDLDRGKPDPQTFLVAAEKLGVAPASCLVIEDAEHGVAAAKAAGMPCIAVRYAERLRGVSQNLDKADAVVEQLGDIDEAMIRNINV